MTSTLSKHKLFHWLLVNPINGLIRFVEKNSPAFFAIHHIAHLHQECLMGMYISKYTWMNACEDAHSVLKNFFLDDTSTQALKLSMHTSVWLDYE